MKKGVLGQRQVEGMVVNEREEDLGQVFDHDDVPFREDPQQGEAEGKDAEQKYHKKGFGEEWVKVVVDIAGIMEYDTKEIKSRKIKKDKGAIKRG